MCLMPVDAATDDRRDGRVCCSADGLLTGQRQWQGLWVSAPEAEFGYLLAKDALQGAISAQQKPRLQELRQELGDKAEAITRRLFGARLGERVTQWMMTENWTALVPSPRLRRALLWQALWHDPLNLYVTGYPKAHECGDSGAILSTIDQGIAYPQQPGQGHSRLRRRGGLLLLVLICMATGCTGSRTRERAAVTVPPAPEKVAVNRVSNARARLSAPPQQSQSPCDRCQTCGTTTASRSTARRRTGRTRLLAAGQGGILFDRTPF